MGLTEQQERVLSDLVARGDEEWYLFGSADSVLRGLDDDPNDIDVLASSESACRFQDEFGEAFVERRSVGASWIDEYELHGEEVEVISEKRNADDWLVDFEEAAENATTEREVPLLGLDAAIAAYRRIDKHETADRLSAAFETEGERTRG